MYSLEGLPGSKRAQVNNANFPAKTIGMRLDDLDYLPNQIPMWLGLVKKQLVIRSSGEKTCGLGLLLQGSPGHGKTTMASAVAQELILTAESSVWGNSTSFVRRPVMFLDYPKLLRLQKMSWSEDDDSIELLIKGLYGEAGKENDICLLILDDLGKEYRTASGWAENTFDALLRARFNAGLPTIVTTNYSLDKWDDMYGESMGSFGHEAFVPIDVVSEKGDRRRWA
jgi:DNA replication protein DnaC